MRDKYKEIARKNGIGAATYRTRLGNGWSYEEASTRPVDKNRSRVQKPKKKTRHNMSYKDHLLKNRIKNGMTLEEVEDNAKQAKTGISPINITPSKKEKDNQKDQANRNALSWCRVRESKLKNKSLDKDN